MLRALGAVSVLLGLLLAPSLSHAIAIGVVEIGEADSAIGPGRSITDDDGNFSIAVVIDADQGESVPRTIAGYQFELTFTHSAADDPTAVVRTNIPNPPFTADIFGPPMIDIPGGTVSAVNAASFSGGVSGTFRIEQFDFTGFAPGVVDIGVLVEGADAIGIDPAGVCGTGRVGEGCDSFFSYGLAVVVGPEEVIPEPGTALLLGAGLVGLSLRGRRQMV